MKKESTLRLNNTLIGQSHNLMVGFAAFATLMAFIGSVFDGVDKVKTAKDINQLVYRSRKLSGDDRKDLAKDLAKNAVLCVIAFAIVWTLGGSFLASKRSNDAVAIRIARRYIIEMRKINPELKKYDSVLNNDMALHNIAAGVLNMMPPFSSIGIGSYYDIVRYYPEDFDSKVGELRIKNKVIESLIEDLRGYTDSNPNFMKKLTALVESSAKTFSLEKYMSNQKVR